MTNANPTDTPMDPGTVKGLRTLPDDAHTPATITAFQQLVGLLMWLLKTRPDLCFTVCLLARYLKCASAEHLKLAMGRPLRYLAGTFGMGVVFQPGSGDWKLHGASDGDLAGDLSSGRSTLGWDVRMGACGNISSSCFLEKKVCTSTGQAETYAFMSLCKELVWLRHLLQELGYTQKDASVGLCDNDGVINQSTKTINHTTAKHYRIAQAFIRQLCRDDVITAVAVDTHNNSADLFTKALAFQAFARHRLSIMGPQAAGA